jgi:hypothetical protein
VYKEAVCEGGVCTILSSGAIGDGESFVKNLHVEKEKTRLRAIIFVCVYHYYPACCRFVVNESSCKSSMTKLESKSIL